MVRFLSVAALVFIGVANVAAAQSLGDVAKKEEQRRKTVKSAGKVYTNDELKRDPTPSVPASASTGTTSTPSASSTPAPAPASSGNNADKDDSANKGGSANKDSSADKSDEKTWRKRITNARESLQRSQAFADALQSQLNALSTDFVNRDDPIQRQQIAKQRDGVVAELDRVKKEVAAQTKAISDIQEEARRANVPAGWVR
jgi:membrane-associated HD superfamily phosphohydrolase